VAEETVSDVIDLGGREVQRTVQKVTFEVEQPFEDAQSKTEIVYGWGTTNDFHFKAGERYLVYGWRQKDGRIRTSKCTRTAPVSEAAEDIEFLRSLPSHKGGEIFGLVRSVSPGTNSGTVAGTITEYGKDGEHKARVTSSGEYELRALAPGDYLETFVPDGTATAYVNLKLTIPVNGSCAESGFHLGSVPLSGKIVSDSEVPVQGAEVFLFYALDGQYHPDVFLRTRTDASGRFRFPRVEAAKFILGARVANSAITFFPNTRESSHTDVIEVRDGTPISGLVVRLSGSSPPK
jgi:hypothetical protein